MKFLLSSLTLGSLLNVASAGSLRKLGRKPGPGPDGDCSNNPFLCENYSFCDPTTEPTSSYPALPSDGSDSYIDATSPWASSAEMSALKATLEANPTYDYSDDLETACGGKTSGSITCSDYSADEDTCNAQASTGYSCAWQGRCTKVSGTGNPCAGIDNETDCDNVGSQCEWQAECKGNGNRVSDWEDSDISCSDTRFKVGSAVANDSIPGDISEDGKVTCITSCTLADGTIINHGEPIDAGSIAGDSFDYLYEESYDGYYICHNPNPLQSYPRTQCQAWDTLPPDMVPGTFAACGWCCQTELGFNKWDDTGCAYNESCGDTAIDPTYADYRFMNLANGQNQKKNFSTKEQCVHKDEVVDNLNQHWGSSCVV